MLCKTEDRQRSWYWGNHPTLKLLPKCTLMAASSQFMTGMTGNDKELNLPIKHFMWINRWFLTSFVLSSSLNSKFQLCMYLFGEQVFCAYILLITLFSKYCPCSWRSFLQFYLPVYLSICTYLPVLQNVVFLQLIFSGEKDGNKWGGGKGKGKVKERGDGKEGAAVLWFCLFLHRF